jgi:hypothetical protein
MNASISRFFIFVFFIGLVFLQASVHQFLFSLVPLMIIIPVVATWGSDRPFLWLIPWVIVGELFATSLPGTITAVALVPLVARWALPGGKTDLSFSFFSILFGTVFLQLAVVAALQALASGAVLLPWLVYIEILCCCTVLAFVVCSIWMQVKPLYD